jgi:hypothetical protein
VLAGFGWLSGDIPKQLFAAARAVYWSGLLYLVTSATLQLRLGIELRRGKNHPGPTWPLLSGGHVVVLLVVVATMAQGTSARIYHTGLEPMIAPLAVASLLAAITGVTTWWRCPTDMAAEGDTPVPRLQWLRLVPFVIAYLLTAAALGYLQLQPLPESPA